VVELPTDLVFDGLWSVQISEAGCFDCIGGGTQRVRAHVADRDGLTGGPRSSRCSRALDVVCSDATGKATANLLRSAELSPGERTSPGDDSPRAIIVWSLSLKQVQNPRRAVGRPSGNKTSVVFAQRLWRCHNPPSQTARASRQIFPSVCWPGGIALVCGSARSTAMDVD
jgi:hypothetical protein